MQMFISSIHSVGIQLFNDMHAILGFKTMKTCEASFFVRAKSICILKNLHLIPALAERHQDDAWENRWSPFSTCRKENVLSGLMVLSAKKMQIWCFSQQTSRKIHLNWMLDMMIAEINEYSGEMHDLLPFVEYLTGFRGDFAISLHSSYMPINYGIVLICSFPAGTFITIALTHRQMKRNRKPLHWRCQKWLRVQTVCASIPNKSIEIDYAIEKMH